MEDHGKIITDFEKIFGASVDHEVIKMILQSCEWDVTIAYEQLLNLSDTSVSNANAEPEIVTASSVLKRNLQETSSLKSKPNINLNQEVNSTAKSNYQEVLSNKIDFCKKLISAKKKIFIIMRGLPGSGKSTLAQSLNTNGVILSTDDYFYDKFKNYSFNPSILSEAHNWNKDRAKFQIYKGITPIFIDNTNLQLWEFEPYLRFALQSGYYVDTLEPQTHWKYDCKTLANKCVHNVSKTKIAEMKERFEINLSIEEILKKLKLSNNLLDIDINYSRSSSQNSDPDIIIEDSSDSSEGENFKKNQENENGIEKVEKISEEVVEDIKGNLKKFLNPKDAQCKNLSEVSKEFAKQSNEAERAEDEAMYRLCSDFEDKLGKPLFSSRSIAEEKVTVCLKEFPEILHSNNDNIISELPGDYLEDWSCISTSEIDDLQSWEANSFEKGKQLGSKSNTSKPQRLNKGGSPLKSLTTYSSSSEELEEDDDGISWKSLNDKSQLSWENNSASPIDHGAIPKRLSKSKLTPKYSPQPHKRLMVNKEDKSTQFYTADYTCLCNGLKIIQGNPLNFISSPLIDVKENEALTKTKLFLHKSSMTDDILEHKNINNDSCPVEELKSFFPDIPSEDLEDMLQKCDYDLDWTMNILIDSGYEICSNAPHKSLQSSNTYPTEDTDSTEESCAGLTRDNQVSASKPDYPFVNCVDDDESIDDCIKNDDKSSSESTTNSLLSENEEDDSAKEGAQYLTMEIDTQFASQLVNLFGPISSMNLSSEFAKEDCKIVLPLELCHDIYKYWAKTLEGKFQHETDILDMFIREDEEFARKLQEEENAGKILTPKELIPPSFQDIVEMQKSENNAKLNTSKEVTCASMMSLQKLQEEYAHVDPTTIEDEYNNMNFDYSATKTVLTYKYGNQKAIPKTVLAPGTTLVHKEDSSSEEEEEEENWEDFAIAVENPQMYRDEAQLHYLERKKALQKAQEASQKGMKSVASYYAQIGNMHMRQFKEANERASKKILDAINSGKGPNTLDLHLLHVDEALREVQRFLSERRNVLNNMNLKQMQVTIITGKGNHSLKGEARLKPAIKLFLQNEGYSCSEYEGMFKVTLRSWTRK